MGDESTKLPPGHRFHPFEHELITLYLKPKVLGEKLPCNVVEERQLYGAKTNPWQVFDPETHPWILSEVSTGKFEKLAYVFVNLTKKSINSKKKMKFSGGREQFVKKAGCGTWDGQTKRTEIKDLNGDLIGERRMLVYEINEVSGLKDFSRLGHWRMHEYSLCGLNKNIPNTAHTVLCKITVDFSKSPVIKLLSNKTLHPIEATISQKENDKNGTQKVDANVCSESIAYSNVVTSPSCDDGVVSIDCCGSKGEEDRSYEIDEAWVDSIFVSDEGEGVSFECPRYPKQIVHDFTTNLGKTKPHVETSYTMSTFYAATIRRESCPGTWSWYWPFHW